MLQLYTGVMGAGKTLVGGLQENVLPALLARRTVIHNIDGLKPGALGFRFSLGAGVVSRLLLVFTTIDELCDLVEANPGSIVVWDECQKFLFPDSAHVQRVLQLIAVSRKLRVDFVLITQMTLNIHRGFLELCECSTHYRRLTFLGMKMSTLAQYREGGNPKLPILMNRRVSYDQRLFYCYDSYASQGSQNDNHARNILLTPKYLFIMVSFFVAVLGIIFLISRMTGYVHNPASFFGHAPTAVSSVASSSSAQTTSVSDTCYKEVSCDEFVCNSAGRIFPANTYDRAHSLFLLSDGTIYRKCSSSPR